MSSSLYDIKPLIPIQDYSLTLFIVVLFIGIVLAYYLFRLVYKKTIKRCNINCEKYYLYKFSNIDWSNPKEAAYLATRYGLILAKDKRRRELFSQLRDRLQCYKYSKNTHKVDQETLRYFNLYKQVCDESL